MHNRFFPLPILLLAAVSLLVSACGSDDGTETTDTTDTTETVEAETSGVVSVGLEEVDGFFIEGFELGLRFEDADGTVLATWRWNDVVAQYGDGSLEAFYQTVLEQPVPAGAVVVLATVNVGIGPPPEVPDLDGEMDCRLEVEVAPDATVKVEVDFSGTSDCLRQLG